MVGIPSVTYMVMHLPGLVEGLLVQVRRIGPEHE